MTKTWLWTKVVFTTYKKCIKIMLIVQRDPALRPYCRIGPALPNCTAYRPAARRDIAGQGRAKSYYPQECV
jgi:hypothetical protein